MKRLLTTAALALALTACSDDSKTPAKVDQPLTYNEAGAKKDGSTVGEAGKGGEAGTIWNCTKLGDCEKPCGTDMTCIGTCKTKACQTAQDAMQKVWDCVLKNCVTDCVTGWGTACDACVAKSCKTEQDACYAQNC